MVPTPHLPPNKVGAGFAELNMPKASKYDIEYTG